MMAFDKAFIRIVGQARLWWRGQWRRTGGLQLLRRCVVEGLSLPLLRRGPENSLPPESDCASHERNDGD